MTIFTNGLKKTPSFWATLALTGLLSLLWASPAHALPTILSEGSQSFEENQSAEMLDNITITEDSDQVYITAGEIKITIPDSLEMIFDDERTLDEFAIFGSAVDSGKVEEFADLSFENGDKTVVIPVLADFDLEEYITVTRLYVEGFHEDSAGSPKLILQINDDATEYLDTRTIEIEDSTLDDDNEPEAPSNLSVTDNADGGVLLTWEDPTDLDLQTIDILRGLNQYPVSGTPYATVAAGEEMYVDTDVEIGDAVSYILRASDGPNTSENTEEVSFVVGSSAEEEEEETTEEETTEGEEEEEEAMAGEEEAEEAAEPEFSDTEGHWAEEEINVMAEIGIVEGNPDGSFAPDGYLNRAEAATLLYRIVNSTPNDPNEMPFSDVELGEWYTPYIAALKDLELIEGNPDGTFEPAENINRAEFLQLALNVYLSLYPEMVELIEILDNEMTTVYADLDPSEWYAGTVDVATDLGFVEGSACESAVGSEATGDETGSETVEAVCFYAANEITRAEATKILYTMFEDLWAYENETLTVTLSEQNDSGQSGSATLTQDGGDVTVTLTTTGFTEGVSQPAHIHSGTCEELGSALYSLENVENGSSETVLEISLGEILANLPLAVNVHKSADESDVYTACGDMEL